MTERMGLVIVGNTLRSDWDAQGVLAGIRGAVWIEVTNRCILGPDIIPEIAELLAMEVAHDALEENIQVNGWKVERVGSRISVSADAFEDTDRKPPKLGSSEDWARSKLA